MKTLLIIDIDDTIANLSHRVNLLPDWKNFFQACDNDLPIMEIINLIVQHKNHPQIECVFITGRTKYNSVEEKTLEWLKKHGLDGVPLYLREVNDFSKSFLFKEKIFRKIFNKHDNVIIIDDDEKIIDHFKNLGHQTILVNKSNYNQTAEDFLIKINSCIKKTKSLTLK